MDELLEQFLIEGRDLVAQAGDDCAALVRNGSTGPVIDSAFRAVHTLKGSAAIVGLRPMEAMLHAAEDLLGTARSAGAAVDPERARALVACIDQCDRWMDEVAAAGELPGDAAAVGAEIGARLRGARSDAAKEPAPSPVDSRWATELVEEERAAIATAGAAGRRLTAIRYLPREDCFFAGDDPLALVAAIPQLVAVRVEAREPWPALEQLDPYRCLLSIQALSSAELGDVSPVFRLIPDQVELAAVQPAAASRGQAAPTAVAADPTIRVDAGQVDRLLDLIGELLVARNQFGAVAGASLDGGLDGELRTSGAAMDRVLRNMHRTVMAMRLVPVDRVFRRVARLVRDTASRLGREVELEQQGLDTTVDKAIADALFDPLLHLARNALDHGIEPPETRAAQGKSPRGTIRLSAGSVGSELVVELADDGKGIDPAVMRRLAVQRGLHGAERAAELSDEEAVQLVFAPGFSSAAEVTDLSGRGVGMDAVKAAVERLGGRTVLASRPGEGTTVTIHLPATAALTSVLTITVAGERFAVPVEAVVQTARIPAAAIRPVGTGQAFVLRDTTIPLLALADLLGLQADRCEGDRRVLVVGSPVGLVGLVVDDFSSRSEVILRPMTGLLSSVPLVSGTTLMNDGSVLFILNLSEVIG
ncbi:chemotaxis protein CheA [Sphingomonas sp. BN140010]|uniref:histidine kinase n=1 Tax=Sphingomonas arvum TaxID=2992113 RepID=A0ABT3JB92_9SPHN|nr:chemotaxis protein CheA [Sphingomonas sp. BN140010]MCW3796329.1 chemotaxis protein CheA [Sphingomonas sp. BN140010]